MNTHYSKLKYDFKNYIDFIRTGRRKGRLALSRYQKFLDEFEHLEDFTGRYPGSTPLVEDSTTAKYQDELICLMKPTQPTRAIFSKNHSFVGG